jgi:hypothetical protein
VHDERVAQEITCISNMKMIGLAFTIWEGDHGYPERAAKRSAASVSLRGGSARYLVRDTRTPSGISEGVLVSRGETNAHFEPLL